MHSNLCFIETVSFPAMPRNVWYMKILIFPWVELFSNKILFDFLLIVKENTK
jgi:hypothetical protein